MKGWVLESKMTGLRGWRKAYSAQGKIPCAAHPDDLYIIYYRGTRRLPMEHGEAVIGTREDCQWDAARLQLRHKKIVDGVQRGCNGDAERQSLWRRETIIRAWKVRQARVPHQTRRWQTRACAPRRPEEPAPLSNTGEWKNQENVLAFQEKAVSLPRFLSRVMAN